MMAGILRRFSPCRAHYTQRRQLHLALSKRSKQLGELLGVTEAAQLQAKLAGVRVLIIDEASLVSEEDLCEIDLRCKSAFPDKAHLPFGGLHVLFTGDFWQLRPVRGRTLMNTRPGHARAQRGRELWLRV